MQANPSNEQTPPLRQLLLVEDNPLFAEQITDAMRGLPDRWKVLEFSEGLLAKAFAKVALKPFDLALIDLGLPDVSGIEVIRACREHFADMPIVVISVVASETAVLAAIEAGANGYILKDESIEEITKGIEQVLKGVYPLSPRLARYLFKHLSVSSDKPEERLPVKLSPREHETLQGLAQGLSYEQVAESMGVTLSTVQSNVRSLYRKLNVKSQSQAVSMARSYQLL
jgi:two-component system nitrate/nitrite response regulator NarL